MSDDRIRLKDEEIHSDHVRCEHCDGRALCPCGRCTSQSTPIGDLRLCRVCRGAGQVRRPDPPAR